MNEIKPLTDSDRLDHAYEMLTNAHALLGVQCQNCRFYVPDPDPDLQGYRGVCQAEEDRRTYWSQYCDDFVWEVQR